MKRFFLLIAAMVCFIIETNAQIINIPADQPTIQAGINAASEGDTVLVAEGTYFENINFIGKAITLASQFLLDGDTAHISKTIIDGSQSTNPNAASVVTMSSGEDTTSVLMGFTITGGKGSIVNLPGFTNVRSGGGILMQGSGGKIFHNVIEENHMMVPPGTWGNFGCGLLADLYDGHTAIIRNNLIRGNTGTNGGGWGGGVMLIGGDVMMENNMVTGNIFDLEDYAVGAGMASFFLEDHTFNKVIIRNNIITKNKANLTGSNGIGAGVALMWAPGQEKVQFYNNVVSENESKGYGGGIYLWANKDLFLVNNTIFGNRATIGGSSFALDPSNTVVLLNNIIWADVNSYFFFFDPKSDQIFANSNLLKGPFRKNDPVVEAGNTYMYPLLDPVTYQPIQLSPAVGRGTDSVEIDGTWYFAPPMDLAGNSRPNAVDGNVDIGAFESAFAKLPVASLYTIQVPDYTLVPEFQPGILEYEVEVPDLYDAFDEVVYIPTDAVSVVDYNPADNILSDNLDDRTSTFSVTSADSSVENVYKILYNALSTDATLSTLSVEPFTLEPEFDPAILEYSVLIPDTITKAPEVTAVPSSDKVEEFAVYNATFADASHMTTRVDVIPEAGRNYRKTYSILFVLVVGIEDGKGPGALKVYPNPFRSTATVEWQSNGIIQRIDLVNMLGQTVRTIDHPQGNSVTLTRENLPSGIYFLKICGEETVITKLMID
ncbi:MAG: T9SS type A sorting domain-containing protein [Bacteroidota bacterium]